MKVKPFLKWAGGKSRLLDKIFSKTPDDIEELADFFVGGGAPLLYMMENFPDKKIYANDINKNIMIAYSVIKDYPVELIYFLKILQGIYKKAADKREYYEEVREYFNKNRIKSNKISVSGPDDKRIVIAAYFIFLNKTCFNGLYRENKDGGFNVPWNGNDKAGIFDEVNILEISKLLNTRNISLFNRDYKGIYLPNVKRLYYFDPPYLPVSKTSNFTSYSSREFGLKEHQELINYCRRIDSEGNYFIISNSDSDILKALYSDFNIEQIEASRMINSKGDGRNKVGEIIVRNF